MELKDIARALASIGLPLIGAALPVPGGMAIGTALAQAINAPSAKPEDILATITGNADALQRAREFEATNHQSLVKIAVDYELEQSKLDAQAVDDVNATMRTEIAQSGSEAWYQKAWRPFCGFVVGLGSLAGVLFTCWLFYLAIVQHDGAALGIVPQLATSIALILGVPGAAVGIAAWTRGKAQIAQIVKDAA